MAIWARRYPMVVPPHAGRSVPRSKPSQGQARRSAARMGGPNARPKMGRADAGRRGLWGPTQRVSPRSRIPTASGPRGGGGGGPTLAGIGAVRATTAPTARGDRANGDVTPPPRGPPRRHQRQTWRSETPNQNDGADMEAIRSKTGHGGDAVHPDTGKRTGVDANNDGILSPDTSTKTAALSAEVSVLARQDL